MGPSAWSRRASRTLLRLAALSAVTLATRSAPADGKAACIAATEQGQRLQAAHKLLEAREEFLRCARPTCPAMVLEACTGWLGDIAKLVPTVVISAKDGAGADLVDVTVTVDSRPLVTKLDGEAVAVDPGPHVFQFALADGTHLDRPFVVLEGQKAQRLAVEGLGGRRAPSPDDAGHKRRVLAVVVGSAGLAGALLGGVFGGLTLSSWDSANSECRSHTNCPAAAVSDRSAAVTFRAASDVGFIAGGILLAGGVALYLTAPKGDSAVTVGILPGGVGLAGRF